MHFIERTNEFYSCEYEKKKSMLKHNQPSSLHMSNNIMLIRTSQVAKYTL